MFETETVGLCLVQKLKWGWSHDPPGPASGYVPEEKDAERTFFCHMLRDFKTTLFKDIIRNIKLQHCEHSNILRIIDHAIL